MHLKTTQERIFLAGDESARITLTLQDEAGRTLPLRVTRAVLHEQAVTWLPGVLHNSKTYPLASFSDAT